LLLIGSNPIRRSLGSCDDSPDVNMTCLGFAWSRCLLNQYTPPPHFVKFQLPLELRLVAELWRD